MEDGPIIKWGGYLSPEYIHILGLIVAEWGWMEAHFDSYHRYLRNNPTAQIGTRIPQGFQQSNAVFLKAAEACFPSEPTLIEKLKAVIVSANVLATQRNRLIHGFWFDVANTEVLVMKYDGDKRSGYTVNLQGLQGHLDDVKRCHGDFLGIFVGWGAIDGGPLTSAEKLALQAHNTQHNQNSPDPNQLSNHPQFSSFRA